MDKRTRRYKELELGACKYIVYCIFGETPNIENIQERLINLADHISKFDEDDASVWWLAESSGMIDLNNDYEELDQYVLWNLIVTGKMKHFEAAVYWFNSKTRAYVHEHNLSYIAPTRCYWELGLEKQNSEDWFCEPV